MYIWCITWHMAWGGEKLKSEKVCNHPDVAWWGLEHRLYRTKETITETTAEYNLLRLFIIVVSLGEGLHMPFLTFLLVLLPQDKHMKLLLNFTLQRKWVRSWQISYKHTQGHTDSHWFLVFHLNPWDSVSRHTSF